MEATADDAQSESIGLSFEGNSDDKLIIEKGSTLITTSYATNEFSESYGIYAYGQMNIEGTLKANGGSGMRIRGIFNQGQVTVNGGMVEAITGTSQYQYADIYGIECIKIEVTKGGTVIASSSPANTSQAIKRLYNPEFNNDEFIIDEGYEYYAGSNPLDAVVVEDFNSAVKNRYIMIKPPVKNYNIWVGGVQVTDENKDSITGSGISGYVAYYEDTNTLVLRDLEIDGNQCTYNGGDKIGIYAVNNQAIPLTVEVIGDNKIEAGTNGWGILVEGDVTINGGGSLSVMGGDTESDNFSHGILIRNGDLTVEEGILSSTGGSATNSSSYGLCVVTIDKGQVEAARSMGFSKVGAFFTVTFPQAVQVAFPTYMSELVSTLKETAVVGYIAIVDLTKAGDIIRSRTYDAFFPLIMVALVYMVAASAMIWLFNFIYRKTNKRMRRTKR